METKLWEAINSNDVSSVSALFKTHPLLQLQQNNHVGFLTCLQAACIEGNPTICTILLENNADAEIKAKINKWTALHYAVKKGNIKCVNILVKHDSDLIKAKTNHGQTALHIASLHNQVSCVKKLLYRKAIINAKDNFGKSALHYAADLGHLDCVKLLIGAGADMCSVVSVDRPKVVENSSTVHLKDAFKTALELAKENKHTSVLQYLEECYEAQNSGKEDLSSVEKDINANTKL